MKKQILALSFGLMTIGAFAQKDELRAAEKALKKDDFKTAKEAILSLEGTEETMDAKYKAEYYFLKGQAYGKSDVKKAAEAYNKLFAFEEEIGKNKYTKEAQPKLNDLVLYVSEKAIKLFNDDKDYKNATENFYLTYKLSPRDTSFLYNAAMSASLAQEYDTSLAYYKELQVLGYTGTSTEYFAKNPDTGEVENLGTKENRDRMIKYGKYTDPTEETSESKQGEIVKKISYILIEQGKTDEAIVAIKEARKTNPTDLNLILNEAQLYIKLEKMDKFAELMQEAIKLDPTNPVLFFNLGVVNANEKKNEEAIGYYKKAIELDPNYGDAYMNLAITLLSGEQEIVAEMNKNLSNIKKYDELEAKQKELYKKALPYLEKADGIKRSFETVKALMNFYDFLRMTEKADAIRVIYKKMREE